MSNPATPDFSYFTRHVGEGIRDRGEIDLEAALLLLKHFHWQDSGESADQADAVPGLRAMLTRIHRGTTTGVRHHAVRDENATGSLIGFRDRDAAELVVSCVDGAFHLDFAERHVRRILPGIHVTRWTLRGAATREIDDVLSLAKLFFAGRKMVLDDLLFAAEREVPSRQSA